MDNNLDVFYPAPLEIPEQFKTDDFVLVPLNVDNVVLDYNAIMDAKKILHELTDGLYPPKDYTVEDNRKDMLLQIDQAENRIEFGYSIFDANMERVLGCLYIKSLAKRIAGVSMNDINGNSIPVKSLDAYFTVWTIPKTPKNFEESFNEAISDWFRTTWNFTSVYRMIEPGLEGKVRKLSNDKLYSVKDEYDRELFFEKFL